MAGSGGAEFKDGVGSYRQNLPPRVTVMLVMELRHLLIPG